MFGSSLLHSYPRIAALRPESAVHGSPMASSGAGIGPFSSSSGGKGFSAFVPPPTISSNSSSAFYPPMHSGEGVDRWRSVSGHVTTPNVWPTFDPTSLVTYQHGSYGGLDVRRKNATRESTSTLKAWLYEHIKNPYPTKGEKIMLAIITKMTLTQVSTWFANARRRLKKENKMQWSPRNRNGDDDDDDDEDDKAISDNDDEAASRSGLTHTDDNDDEDEDVVVDSGNDDSSSNNFPEVEFSKQSEQEQENGEQEDGANSFLISLHRLRPSPNHEIAKNSSCFGSSTDLHSGVASSQSVSTATVAISTKPSDKPRIWSLADVATSVTPPGGCHRRHVVNPTSQSVSATTDLRSLPPGNNDDHVTSEQSCCPPIRASPAYRSFQPWTTSATSLPVHDAASGSIGQDAGSRENGGTRLHGLVAIGNSVFCSFTGQRASNQNIPVPSDIHSSNGANSAKRKTQRCSQIEKEKEQKQEL